MDSLKKSLLDFEPANTTCANIWAVLSFFENNDPN